MSKEKSNDRRWELIYKQLCGDLTEEETQELKKLNEALPKHGMHHTDRKLVGGIPAEEYYD